MSKPSIYISHSWGAENEYQLLINAFNQYGFVHRNSLETGQKIFFEASPERYETFLREQVRMSNYFIISACIECDTRWCEFEVALAREYNKPILSFKPAGYTGSIPTFITEADNQGGPISFGMSSIIRKICAAIALTGYNGVGSDCVGTAPLESDGIVAIAKKYFFIDEPIKCESE
jgi:hypothetical protein